MIMSMTAIHAHVNSYINDDTIVETVNQKSQTTMN